MMNRKLFSAQLVVIFSCSLAQTGFATEANDTSSGYVGCLKARIAHLAAANTTNNESLTTVRTKLDALVDELTTLRPPQAAYQQLPQLEGAWQELWSDDRQPEDPGSRIDRRRVYQVVTRAGYFYNIAERVDDKGNRSHVALRGEYQFDPDDDRYLIIEFTNLGVREGKLPDFFPSISAFVSAVERDLYTLRDLSSIAVAPRGPVGQRGKLRNVYLDDTLRIAKGFNLADGKVNLYILSKVESFYPQKSTTASRDPNHYTPVTMATR